MNKMQLCAIVVCVVAMSLALPASAQEAAASQLIRIQQTQVDPSKTADFEAAVTEIISIFREQNLSVPVQAGVSEESEYGFVVPVADLAALDQVGQEVAKIGQAAAGKYSSALERIGAATIGNTVWLAQTRPDLSYTPENPRLSPTEATFTHYIFLCINPGSEAAVENSLKSIAALWKKEGVTDSFASATAITGTDLPLIVVGIPAKNVADYYAAESERDAKLGEEQAAAVAEIVSNIRKIERINVTARPDLSYSPMSE